MVNMKMSKEEAKEQTLLDEPKQEEYPFGLCISLDDESLQKLGIKEIPKVGAEYTFEAKAVVTRTSSSSDTQGEDESTISLQITDLDFGADTDDKSPAAMLYGK